MQPEWLFEWHFSTPLNLSTSTSLRSSLTYLIANACRPHLSIITTHRNAYRHLTVFLLASMAPCTAPSFGIGALYYRDPYSSPVASLATRLHEETRYAATLKARQGLIKKHGPSKEEIESYPATGSYSTQYGDFFIPSFQCPRHVERIGVLGDGGKWPEGTCALLPVDARHRKAHGPEDSPKYYTLDALMTLNGHTFIDVLKNDFEGAKFDTLTAFLATHKPLSPFSSTTLPIGQLQIELHTRDDYDNFDFFHDRCAALEAAGMRPFLTESNLVYVNYNTGGCRVLVYEYPRESFSRLRGSRRSRCVL
ncbi:hypothetical protein EDB85DRAFT_2272225 [Lactarius pseudohatsudake]|nr:hypothetical protein EDB85DRAFT_2272225 [Lactarius pseudohatsudake]